MEHVLSKRIRKARKWGRRTNKNPTYNIAFITRKEMPHDRRKDATYRQFMCSVRPEKRENNRTIFNVCGDKIDYPGEVATPPVYMLVAKIIFNSIISTKEARFMTIDISNFYLMTPLKRPEYIRINVRDIPDEIIKEYKLKEKRTQKVRYISSPTAECMAYHSLDY